MAKKLFLFSKDARVYVILTSVLVILMVALVLAKRQREAFNSPATPSSSAMSLPANWKGPKTLILTREGIHAFFTDGSMLGLPQALESRVLFTPTDRDTQCYLTNAPHASFNCRHIPVEDFASVDTASSTPPSYSCTSIDSIRPMHNATDDSVRILNCEYRFHKQCLQLHQASMSNNGTVITMQLPVNELSTTLFVLSRPVFVKSTNSVLYKVSYMPSDYAASGIGKNSIIDFDNQSKSSVRVVLRPVSGEFNGQGFTLSAGRSSLIDDAVASDAAATELTSTTGTPQQPKRIDRIQPPIMPITMFYLKAAKSVADDIPLTEAFTLFFANVSPMQQQQSQQQQQLMRTLFNHSDTITITSSQATLTATSCTIRVRRQSSIAEVANVPLKSALMVTYSVNCLTVVLMDVDTGKMSMKRFPSFLPALSINDPTSLQQAIRAANAQLPAPLISLSIASPLDVARLINMPLAA